MVKIPQLPKTSQDFLRAALSHLGARAVKGREIQEKARLHSFRSFQEAICPLIRHNLVWFRGELTQQKIKEKHFYVTNPPFAKLVLLQQKIEKG